MFQGQDDGQCIMDGKAVSVLGTGRLTVYQDRMPGSVSGTGGLLVYWGQDD